MGGRNRQQGRNTLLAEEVATREGQKGQLRGKIGYGGLDGEAFGSRAVGKEKSMEIPVIIRFFLDSFSTPSKHLCLHYIYFIINNKVKSNKIKV